MIRDVPQSLGDEYELANSPDHVAPTPAAPVEGPSTVASPEAAASVPTPATAPPAAAEAAPPQSPPTTKNRAQAPLKWDLSSWGVSLLVHGLLAVVMGVVTLNEDLRDTIVASIDAAMLDTSEMADELTPIYADPNENPRESAVDTSFSLGGAAPSNTPTIRSATATAQVAERTSLASFVPSVAAPSNLSLMPSAAALNRDLSVSPNGGGGKLRGDVTRVTSDIGEALDQLAREILRQLAQYKITVVWLFDESGSMKDDQKTVKEKFVKVIDQLDLNVPRDQKEAGALNHAIVSFGQGINYRNTRPTFDVSAIRTAIDRIPIDESGTENTMKAVASVIGAFDQRVEKDRRILLVLVTDESGDDGSFVEEARLAAVNRAVPVYVLGRQSLFGYETLSLRYVDPVTKDEYWPPVRRGPETAGLENLQWDGLHTARYDEQPSGFAPYELARLVEQTGGIYFLLPTEENDRVRRREQAYSMTTMKEYKPDYSARPEYNAALVKSELRRSLLDVIQSTKGKFGFRDHYPVEPQALVKAINEELPKVVVQLNVLIGIEKRMRQLESARDREPEKRWQASYDLILAQIVAYQVKAYEYRACLAEMMNLLQQNKLAPKNPPIANLRRTDWVIHHSRDRKAPMDETAKKYAEAESLLKLVIQRHPKTPWADLAQDEINRGFGCQRGEWSVHPSYDDRARFVPKY